jgi:hypothetical protein
MNKIAYYIILLSLFSIFLSSCGNSGVNTYKTYVFNEGILHFSLEYRAYYKVDWTKPAESTGYPTQQAMSFDLISPKIKGINDYTYIKVLADKPDDLIPDAKSAMERAQRNASSWADYKLLDKSEITIDSLHAYRLDYQIRNVIGIIAGTSGPRISVYREVHFDAKGYVWLIQIRSDSTTAEADKADFEHILQTFKILD